VRHRRREPSQGVFRLVLPLPFPGLDHVNAYVMTGDDGAILVDCGIWDPSLAPDHGLAELVGALEVCDIELADIKVLVVTHTHVDHYGMAGRVVEATGCELWMHELAADDLRLYRDPRAATEDLRALLVHHGVDRDRLPELTGFEDWRSFVSSPVNASRELRGGETLSPGALEWTIVHTPGHARSHICLWEPSRRILISGDTLLGAITPHIDFRGDDDGNPLGDFLSSLERIEELQPDLVFPGHGRPFEDGAERARVIARHHDRRLGAILQVIRREPHTAAEITDAIFGDALLNFQRRMALGEALAHLAYLLANGEVERIESDDGTYLYEKLSTRRKDPGA
jgi:glyoxylase-like metal-dependent hydrolase (beta-lactamase superfamily II)